MMLKLTEPEGLHRLIGLLHILMNDVPNLWI